MFIFAVFILFLVCGEIFAFFRPGIGEHKAQIQISKNSSTARIAKILKSNKIIGNEFLFSQYVKLSKTKLKYGVFYLNSKMSYGEIVKHLIDDLNNAKIVTKLNIFEGSNFFNLQKKYGSEENFNFAEIVEKINDPRVYGKFRFFNMLKNKQLKNAYYPMEGFCAPYSFNIKNDYDSLTIANLVLSKFDEAILPLIDDIKKSDFSFWEIITLASIIQAETSKVDDMPKISSVLHNRLKEKRKRLECDSTSTYARKMEDEMKNNKKFVNKNLIESYDTYKCFGLPVGPICNPGIDAIKAAINPAKTNYWFFCINLFDGTAFFAENFKDHKINLKKIRTRSKNQNETENF